MNQYVIDEVCPSYFIPEQPVIQRCVPEFILQLGTALESSIAANISTAQGQCNQTAGGGGSGACTMPSAVTIKSEEAYVQVLLSVKEFGEKIFGDLQRIWWLILICLVVAMVVAFLWILLMQWISGVMIWLSIFLSILLLAAGAAFCWWKWWQLKSGQGTSFQITTRWDSYLQMTDTWLGFAIIFSVAFLIISLIILFLRNRIRIAIALIKESSRYEGE